MLAVARELEAQFVCPTGEEGEDCAVREGAAAVLLLADPGNLDQAASCLRRLAAGKSRKVPIIAVLSRQEAVASCVRAQWVLSAAGADDVILNADNRGALRAAFAMGIARTEIHHAAIHAAEEDAEERAHKNLGRSIAEDKRKKRPEAKTSLFWQVVHSVFESVPEIDHTLPKVPRQGAWVGHTALDSFLDEGGFGQVWEGSNHETGDLEAVKCISKDSLASLDDVRALSAEVLVLQKLRHPNIVGFRGIVHGPSHIFVRMDLAGRYNMLHAMRLAGGRFGLEAARRFMQQVASALAHCHANGLAHRDVKPENVGISDDGARATLLDFGSAAAIAEPCCDMAGTMPFMAPEVLAAENERPYRPDGVDVWSAGVVLVEMLCGYGKLNKMLGWDATPAPRRARRDELRNFFDCPGLLEEALAGDLGEAAGPDLLVLLGGMLQVDRRCRATAEDVLQTGWLRQAVLPPS